MELHLRGFSLARVKEKCLEERLVPIKLMPHYWESAVDKHLKNEFYAAIPKPHDGFKSQCTWRGVWYEGRHEPIFSADEWTRLQASFGLKAAFRKRKHEGLFTDVIRLRCGDPACGCTITYAPKAKGGRTYPYYRCSDGKRVHQRRGERQINVTEDALLEQLGTAVNVITITEDLAQVIANALSETHRQAQRAKEAAAATFRAQLVAVDAGEDRLYDRLDRGEIDSEAFKRQRERLRRERDEFVEKLREADRLADDRYLVTAERVLELAKCARDLWKQRSREERRDLLTKLLCNPTLDGRTVRFDLKKPFDVLAKMRDAKGWRPQRETYAISRAVLGRGLRSISATQAT